MIPLEILFGHRSPLVPLICKGQTELKDPSECLKVVETLVSIRPLLTFQSKKSRSMVIVESHIVFKSYKAERS